MKFVDDNDGEDNYQVVIYPLRDFVLVGSYNWITLLKSPLVLTYASPSCSASYQDIVVIAIHKNNDLILKDMMSIRDRTSKAKIKNKDQHFALKDR